jgi:putative endonuclease
MKKHYVYILRCADGTLYTGWTTDLTHRLRAHNAGKGAKYTKGRGPVCLVHHEVFDDKGSALKREAEIKKLTRSRKMELIRMNPTEEGESQDD